MFSVVNLVFIGEDTLSVVNNLNDTPAYENDNICIDFWLEGKITANIFPMRCLTIPL